MKTVVRIPGPSWTLYRCMLKMMPVVKASHQPGHWGLLTNGPHYYLHYTLAGGSWAS